MDTVTIDRSLDRTGKSITTYVVYDVVTELAGMEDGDVLELTTDDYQPISADIQAWCEMSGHRLLASERIGGRRRFVVEKRSVVREKTAMAMVISDNGLEELLSPLGFALAAALEGMDVSLFVQGPAVRVLKKGFHPKLKGWARPFSRFASTGMARTGHVPALEKIRQLRSLGADIYMCGPSMEHFKVRPEDLVFDDLSIVEYLTFTAVMEKADIHLYA